MNVSASDLHASAPPMSRPESLIYESSRRLRNYAEELGPLRTALQNLSELDCNKTAQKAKRLSNKLNEVEPSFTLIGQIKSGKTTLVNALVGRQNLLPADVNPWTSVVTSLHLSPHKREPETSAKFRFFEIDDWDNLVRGGGRIGEMANRAGADDEFSKIHAQVQMMREKSKKRLGRKFEALLGTEHSYGYFDPELIERYVCLGDDFEGDNQTSQTRGRFADITKSADLMMQQRGYQLPLCIRDTPGVNDTFMIREQITIQSIRDSRVCVVVLSAHQALSSTDLALVRLISNVKSREVIIFINRIDELSEPKTQVPEIEKSIVQTLATHQGPTDAKIIFGSGLWAQAAMDENINVVAEASQEALLNWAEVAQLVNVPTDDPYRLMWELSGLPALIDTLSERVIEGEWRHQTRQIALELENLIKSVKISDKLQAKTNVTDLNLRMSKDEVLAQLGAITDNHTAKLSNELDGLITSFRARVEQAQNSFLNRAMEALAKHLEFYGERSAWTYDPAGIRLLFASAYKSYGARSQSAFKAATRQLLLDLSELFERFVGLQADLFDPTPPDVPRIAPPVTLGQTIALDLQERWWKGWWTRRQSYEAQAKNFYDLVKVETDSLVADLVSDQAEDVRSDLAMTFDMFVRAQTAVLAEFAQEHVLSGEAARSLLGVTALEERDITLTAASASLERYTT